MSDRPPPGRRYARQLARCLLVLAALDLLARVGLEPLVVADPHQPVSTLWRIALYHHAGPVDVLLLGSSRVQEGLSPALIARRLAQDRSQPVRILNLGLSKGTPLANYWLLKNVVLPDRPPRVIVYGAAEYEFNAHLPLAGDPYAEELATVADYPQAFPDITQHVDTQLSFLLGRPWYLFQHRTDLHDVLTDRVSDRTTWATGSVQDAYGYVPNTRVLNADLSALMQGIYGGPDGWLRNYTVGPPATPPFESFLQLAQARGIRVIVLNMPVARVHETFMPAASFVAYQQYLRDTTARYGATFVDYADHALWVEPADFADTNHLNVTGAAKLSARVGGDVLLPALRALGGP